MNWGALIKGALFYVSADTGPLHIATAFKKDLVALYGPTARTAQVLMGMQEL